jgi:hypothetical protein
MLVARAHGDSVCHPHQLGNHRQFPSVPKDELPIEFYDAVSKPAPAPKVVTKPKPVKTKSKNTGE